MKHVPEQDSESSSRNVRILVGSKMKIEKLRYHKTACRTLAVRPRDQDDPLDDAHPEGENSANKMLIFLFLGMTLMLQHDDEFTNEASSQDIMDDSIASLTIDESKLRKMSDEMLREICQKDPEAPALSLIIQDLLYLKKGNSGPEKIVLSLHKFPTVIFNDDDIEERTSRWESEAQGTFIRMYTEVFGIDGPLTQSQPIESTQGTHRTPSAPRRYLQSSNYKLQFVPKVDKADEMILQNDESIILGTRIDPRSIKESPLVEIIKNKEGGLLLKGEGGGDSRRRISGAKLPEQVGIKFNGMLRRGSDLWERQNIKDKERLETGTWKYWLALQMKFERNTVPQTACRTPAVRIRDQDDPHDDAYPEVENSATVAEKTISNITEEVSLTIDEAKLRKMADEMLRQRCTSGDEHQYHIDQMKNFLKSIVDHCLGEVEKKKLFVFHITIVHTIGS
ncbi:hypothetical protein Tco_0973319 [Tanacetum coccineum]